MCIVEGRRESVREDFRSASPDSGGWNFTGNLNFPSDIPGSEATLISSVAKGKDEETSREFISRDALYQGLLRGHWGRLEERQRVWGRAADTLRSYK